MSREDEQEQRIAQKQDRCIHFTGIFRNNSCKAGVKYADVAIKHDPPIPYFSRGVQYACGKSHPCHAKHNHGGATCAKREAPTREEAERQVAQSQAAFQRVVAARAAIVKETEDRRGMSGRAACPNCIGGVLTYSVAGGNGHIHARCSTPACCAWME